MKIDLSSWPLSTSRTLACGGVICALFAVGILTESFSGTQVRSGAGQDDTWMLPSMDKIDVAGARGFLLQTPLTDPVANAGGTLNAATARPVVKWRLLGLTFAGESVVGIVDIGGKISSLPLSVGGKLPNGEEIKGVFPDRIVAMESDQEKSICVYQCH